jgi:dipeptidyl aminopeptidase/acylaminoacyl peptidase
MIRSFLLLVLVAGLSQQAAPPDTDVFLVDVHQQGSRMTFGMPQNITHRQGYDNQPSFLPNGNALFYTSARNGGPTDIYRYDIASKTDRQITKTPEGEYSATVMPGGASFSVIRVEADSTQRLWKFPIDGGTPSLVLENIKPVGYHAWFDDKTILLFVLGNPATLQLADVPSGKAITLANNPGRSLHRIPGQPRMSFVHKASKDEWTIQSLDPKTHEIKPLVKTLPGAEDYVWIPDGKTILMAKGSKLFRWSSSQNSDWQEIADFSSSGVREMTRLAISPHGDRLAFVAAGEPR